jgi:hypothetical protein
MLFRQSRGKKKLPIQNAPMLPPIMALASYPK